MDDDRNPTRTLHFRHPWRPYQRRVLDAIDAHLSDRRLHIVAAPGAGKTSLGLEVFRRLGRPTAVLAPSRTIRDQWIRRLTDFVLDDHPWPPPWAGRSLDDPAFLTVLTYQALHTRYRGDRAMNEESEPGSKDSDELEASPTSDELREVAERLRSARVGVLILDEAHHLRAAWWKALTRLVETLDEGAEEPLKVVALTATPPYDVVGREWKRYEELCGPIDEEISIPELVLSGTLCPHQDFVWAVPPSEKDRVRAVDHDRAVETVTGELFADATFRDAIRSHPWGLPGDPANELDPAQVLDDPELAVALLVFLREIGDEPPAPLMELLDCRADELPALDRRWWQLLVHRYLFKSLWEETAEVEKHRKALARRLREERLLHGRELRIHRNRIVETGLAMTASKIEACAAIHGLERDVRGDDLRQVILTDFIREDETGRLGAWPVFRRLLCTENGATVSPDIAMLTGRRTLLHQSRLERFRELLGSRAASLTTEPIVSDGTIDDGWVTLGIPGGGSSLVRPVTRLLQEGRIRTLVGTRALLGEGWDAPVVNSLVLASYVGTHMLSNQMRGRAIRIDPGSPQKAASIWHLVAIDTRTPTGFSDLEQLRRRFETFVGVAEKRPVIESGLERLDLPPIWRPDHIEVWNTLSTTRLRDLGALEGRWRDAVSVEGTGRVVSSVETRDLPTVRPFLFANTLRYLMYSALSAFSAGAGRILQAGQHPDSLRVLLAVLIVSGIVGLLFSLPSLIKLLWVATRHVPVDGTLRQIALTVRDALCRTDLVKTAPANLDVRTCETTEGIWSISMRGGTFYEESLFADCIAEVLGTIENPRYLVTRPGTGWWRRRQDFHPVPTLLGANKDRATAFARIWKQRIGPSELIYTRSREGRRTLLRARGRALSSSFTDRARRRDRWQ